MGIIKEKHRKYVDLLIAGVDKKEAIKQTIPESKNWSEVSWRIMPSKILKMKPVKEYYDKVSRKVVNKVSTQIANEVVKESKWTRDKCTNVLLKLLDVLEQDFTESAKVDKSLWHSRDIQAKVQKRNETARTMKELASELNKVYQIDKGIDSNAQAPVVFTGECNLEEYNYNDEDASDE